MLAIFQLPVEILGVIEDYLSLSAQATFTLTRQGALRMSCLEKWDRIHRFYRSRSSSIFLEESLGSMSSTSFWLRHHLEMPGLVLRQVSSQ